VLSIVILLLSALYTEGTTCPHWDIVYNGYRESCGGADGNIACFDGQTLAETQDFCCSRSDCVGFSWAPSAGSGCYKIDSNCGYVNNVAYVGYFKPMGVGLNLYNGNLSLSATSKNVLVSASVQVTVTTTPPIPDITLYLKDHLTQDTLASVITGSDGYATVSLTVTSPQILFVQAEIGYVMSEVIQITFRAPDASNTYHDNGHNPSCPGNSLFLTSRVSDKNKNGASGSLTYYGDSAPLGTQNLNSGVTTNFDASAYIGSDFGSYYVGGGQGAHINTFFIC